MITRLLSPSPTSTRFSAEQLPEAVHRLVLQEVMAPIIQSESMAPTIQAGDGLDIEDATELQIGDVVVYRHDRLFVCHRIHGIEGHWFFLRGDATTGPYEKVDILQVVGRVDWVFRDGKRRDLRQPRLSLMGMPDESAGGAAWPWSSRRTRALIVRFMNWIAGVPGIKGILRSILRRLMIITIMERAELQSLDGYVTRDQLRLDQLTQYLSTSTGSDILLMVHVGLSCSP